MSHPQSEIAAALRTVQRRLTLHTGLGATVRVACWTLPAAAMVIAADQRWLGGGLFPVVFGVAVLVPLAWGVWESLRAARSPLACAMLLDARTGLKSRVSSAYEFLADADTPSGPRAVQVADALAHLHAFDWAHHFRLTPPRQARWLLAGSALIVGALLVPAAGVPTAEVEASVAVSPHHAAQAAELAEVRALIDELASDDPESEAIRDALADLEAQFEAGQLDEREVMIALSRLEASLSEQMQQGDASTLARETETVAPALQTSGTTMQAGEALMREQAASAAESLRAMAEAMRRGEYMQDELQSAARAMRMAAQRLQEAGGESGQPPAGARSLAHDLSAGADALDRNDPSQFGEAMESMGRKLDQVQQFQSMQAMQRSLAEGKTAMAMAEGAGEPQEGAGGSDGLGTDAADGEDGEGQMAGVGEHGVLDGDAARLEDSLREMLAVRGQLGEGEMQSRFEAVEGQLSPSALDVREVHAEFVAAAEEAIERESVPLSHRQHVRRYFEAIRPQAE